jgi:hypothetical protein
MDQVDLRWTPLLDEPSFIDGPDWFSVVKAALAGLSDPLGWPTIPIAMRMSLFLALISKEFSGSAPTCC